MEHHQLEAPRVQINALAPLLIGAAGEQAAPEGALYLFFEAEPVQGPIFQLGGGQFLVVAKKPQQLARPLIMGDAFGLGPVDHRHYRLYRLHQAQVRAQAGLARPVAVAAALLEPTGQPLP